MADEKEIARMALDYQARSRDYRLLDIPGYWEWSRQRLKEGESQALIAHLDATSICLLPEELSSFNDQSFEEMLEELKNELSGQG